VTERPAPSQEEQLEIRLKSDVETTDLLKVQLAAFLFGFLSGVAAALITVWLIKQLWPEAWG